MQPVYIIWDDLEQSLPDRKFSLSQNVISQSIQVLVTSHLSFLDWKISPAKMSENLALYLLIFNNVTR